MKLLDPGLFTARSIVCPDCLAPVIRMDQGDRIFLVERLARDAASSEVDFDFSPHLCKGYLDRLAKQFASRNPGEPSELIP